MTSADSGRNSLQLIGPKGLNSFWNSTNNFTHRSQFNIQINEITQNSLITTTTTTTTTIEWTTISSCFIITITM